MFPTWMRLMFESSLLGLEAQRVIALRMMALAGGGSRAQAEAQRMITEKGVAQRIGSLNDTAAHGSENSERGTRVLGRRSPRFPKWGEGRMTASGANADQPRGPQ